MSFLLFLRRDAGAPARVSAASFSGVPHRERREMSAAQGVVDHVDI